MPSSNNATTLPAPTINPEKIAKTTLRSWASVFTLLMKYTNDRKYKICMQNSNSVKYNEIEFIKETWSAHATFSNRLGVLRVAVSFPYLDFCLQPLLIGECGGRGIGRREH
jgi:hypothetical protein